MMRSHEAQPDSCVRKCCLYYTEIESEAASIRSPCDILLLQRAPHYVLQPLTESEYPSKYFSTPLILHFV